MEDNREWQVEVNLEEAVKERLEGIVERGIFESPNDQILVSTTALVEEFLQIRNDQDSSEIKAKLLDRKEELGFFFPAIIEAILGWRVEGRKDIPEKIKRLSEVGEI